MTTKRKSQRFIQCDATMCSTSFAPKLTFPFVCSPKPTLTLSGKMDNDKGPDPTRQSPLFSRFQPSRARRSIKTTRKHSASFNSTRPCAASVLLPGYRSNALQVIKATGAVTRIPIQRVLLRHTVPQRCIFHVGPWLRQASPKGQMTDNFRHIFSERKSTSHHRRLFHHQNPIFFIAHVSWCTSCQYLTVSLLSSIAVTIGSSGFGRIGRPVLHLHEVLIAARFGAQKEYLVIDGFRLRIFHVMDLATQAMLSQLVFVLKNENQALTWRRARTDLGQVCFRVCWTERCRYANSHLHAARLDCLYTHLHSVLR